jgi:hypothetical protein
MAAIPSESSSSSSDSSDDEIRDDGTKRRRIDQKTIAANEAFMATKQRRLQSNGKDGGEESFIEHIAAIRLWSSLTTSSTDTQKRVLKPIMDAFAKQPSMVVQLMLILSQQQSLPLPRHFLNIVATLKNDEKTNQKSLKHAFFHKKVINWPHLLSVDVDSINYSRVFSIAWAYVSL